MNESIDIRAFNEIEEVIKHLSVNLQSKIPKSFLNFIIKNKSTDYIFMYDENKRIDEQNLLEDSKLMLTIIYRDYLCSTEQRKTLETILIENERNYEEELKRKYNTDNLFKNKKNYSNHTENVAIVEYKESIFKRIINKIRSIFK